ncbi:MAG: DUF4385 domain-containing protein [Armatimonadaceae bacterium]
MSMQMRVNPKQNKMSSKKRDFDYSLNFSSINFRERPDLYRVGKGEQGVLLVEPYKSELLPHWRFRTPEIARQSAEEIYRRFEQYRDQNDFVGMDMARKFLQMGYTRSRRYANHRSGKKHDGHVPDDKKGQSGAWGRDILPREEDPEKAESARIFYEYYLRAREDALYQERKKEHQAQYG